MELFWLHKHESANKKLLLKVLICYLQQSREKTFFINKTISLRRARFVPEDPKLEVEDDDDDDDDVAISVIQFYYRNEL